MKKFKKLFILVLVMAVLSVNVFSNEALTDTVTDAETQDINNTGNNTNTSNEDEEIIIEDEDNEETGDDEENQTVADENTDNNEDSKGEDINNNETNDKTQENVNESGADNLKTKYELLEEELFEIGDVNNVAYEIFRPENGVIGRIYMGGRYNTLQTEIMDCFLVERITFKGVYEEENYGIDDFGIAEENEVITGTIEHYITDDRREPEFYTEKERRTNLYVLNIYGSKGEIRRWFEEIYNAEMKENGFSFVSTFSVKSEMAYKKDSENSGLKISNITIRGGAENDKIIEIWALFSAMPNKHTSKKAGIIKSTDIEYEEFNPDTTMRGSQNDDLFETLSIENNSTIGATPGVPLSHQNKTKEEQIKEYGNYYDENGINGILMHTGTLKGIKYEDPRIENTVEFTINNDFSDISSNGKTNFTLYEISVLKGDTEGEKTPKREYYDALLKVEGNLGKKIYLMGSRTWKIPEGSKVYGREFLDGNSSYYTWSEVGEITDEYFEIIGGRGTEAASMTFHFSDDKRTGIDDIDFDFNGTKCTVKYDSLDYKGPFLSYFLYDLDNWPEMAKSFGITPVKKEG